MVVEVCHAFAVDLDNVEVGIGPVDKVFCQHPHSGADLQHMVRFGCKAADDAAGDTLVGEEVLPEEFLRSYFGHFVFRAL